MYDILLSIYLSIYPILPNSDLSIYLSIYLCLRHTDGGHWKTGFIYGAQKVLLVILFVDSWVVVVGGRRSLTPLFILPH